MYLTQRTVRSAARGCDRHRAFVFPRNETRGKFSAPAPGSRGAGTLMTTVPRARSSRLRFTARSDMLGKIASPRLLVAGVFARAPRAAAVAGIAGTARAPPSQGAKLRFGRCSQLRNAFLRPFFSMASNALPGGLATDAPPPGEEFCIVAGEFLSESGDRSISEACASSLCGYLASRTFPGKRRRAPRRRGAIRFWGRVRDSCGADAFRATRSASRDLNSTGARLLRRCRRSSGTRTCEETLGSSLRTNTCAARARFAIPSAPP